MWDEDKHNFESRDDVPADEKITAEEWNNHVEDQKSHAQRHESEGSDELNVDGLSGVLDDDQPNQTHDNEDHKREFVDESEAAEASPVQSVFGRVGDVVAQSGDYAASQIDNFATTVINSISGSEIEPNTVSTNSLSTEEARIGEDTGEPSTFHGEARFGAGTDYQETDARNKRIDEAQERYLYHSDVTYSEEIVGYDEDHSSNSELSLSVEDIPVVNDLRALVYVERQDDPGDVWLRINGYDESGDYSWVNVVTGDREGDDDDWAKIHGYSAWGGQSTISLGFSSARPVSSGDSFQHPGYWALGNGQGVEENIFTGRLISGEPVKELEIGSTNDMRGEMIVIAGDWWS